MWVTLAVQVLEALATAVSQLAPLITQGNEVLSESDATKVHDALKKAEDATAALRPQVDAALESAAQR